MTTINVKGPIVADGDKWFYDYFKMPATAPKDINDSLPEDGSDVDVVINSGGGMIDSGSEIYTALKSYKGTVNVQIVGMAASAASVIAMAGDHIAMSPTAQMMIHNVQSSVYGDSVDHQKEAAVLETFNKSISAPYVAKTGMSQDDVLSMMDKTTWLNADDAKAKGLVDEVMFDETEPELQLTAAYNAGLVAPDVINKAREALVDKTKSSKASEQVITIDDKALSKIVAEQINVLETKYKNQSNEQSDTFQPFVF
ncbi:head maturation protease, ClpP-related [Paucilactobacillus kaifaensis]|uniref:head maturation protease, ClpP-related n=1 Tax=Paucilactobacillus kaifaensis TaxID=2559921 RepID=UPI0010F989CA|nr:head maturation protease, ClpP-related [Paucilactobacillus kaifaensis]